MLLALRMDPVGQLLAIEVQVCLLAHASLRTVLMAVQAADELTQRLAVCSCITFGAHMCIVICFVTLCSPSTA